MRSGSSTTGHWDNQSLDCRSGSCTVGTIHLNPTAAGKGGGRNEEMRERRKKRSLRRENEGERERWGTASREKSQGEAVENQKKRSTQNE